MIQDIIIYVIASLKIHWLKMFLSFTRYLFMLINK